MGEGVAWDCVVESLKQAILSSSVKQFTCFMRSLVRSWAILYHSESNSAAVGMEESNGVSSPPICPLHVTQDFSLTFEL